MHWRSAVLAAAALPLVALLAQPAAAQGLTKTSRLSAAIAYQAVSTAVEVCAKQNQQVTAVVLDPAGTQLAFLRGDGAGIRTVDMADYKACTAVSFRADTADLVARARNAPAPSAFAKIHTWCSPPAGWLSRSATRSAARPAATTMRSAPRPASARSATG
jgi:Haem-degrading